MCEIGDQSMETAKSAETVLHLRKIVFHYLLIAACSDSRRLAVPLYNGRGIVVDALRELYPDAQYDQGPVVYGTNAERETEFTEMIAFARIS